MLIHLVCAARPNFMKIAPLISGINKFNNSINSSNPSNPSNSINPINPINYILVHTGQHYDVAMSETFFREFELPNPDVNLEVGSGSHAVQTAKRKRIRVSGLHSSQENCGAVEIGKKTWVTSSNVEENGDRHLFSE